MAASSAWRAGPSAPIALLKNCVMRPTKPGLPWKFTQERSLRADAFGPLDRWSYHPVVVSAVGADHLLGMFPRCLGQLRTREHACHFFGALFSCDLSNRGSGSTGGGAFFDQVVLIGKRGNLRKVRDAQHLIGLRQRLQFFADRLRRAAANSGIDFVEHEGAMLNRVSFSSRGT